jgi:hypothetical protein
MSSLKDKISYKLKITTNLDNRVLFLVNKDLFLLRKIAPKQENNTVKLIADSFDHEIGKFLPTKLRVRIRHVLSKSENLITVSNNNLLDSESRVQQENALLCPLSQISVLRNLEIRILFGQFLENVLQRRRLRNASRN